MLDQEPEVCPKCHGDKELIIITVEDCGCSFTFVQCDRCGGLGEVHTRDDRDSAERSGL